MAHLRFTLMLKSISRLTTKGIGVTACAFLMPACSGVSLVPVSFNIASSSLINSSENETSLPVRVRIYQLSELNKFKDATFRELWKMDKQTLGDTLISSKELTVTPSLHSKFKLDRQTKANYIGVMALFRHPELGKWRAYQKVDSQASSLISSMTVRIDGNSVRIK